MRSMKIKISKPAIIAMIMWVMAIVLPGIVPAKPQFLWTSDALLLFGFFPLLIACRANWLWLVFGLLNMTVGWFLAMAYMIPEERFAVYHLAEIKKHVDLYHPLLVWLLIGFLATIIGVVRLLIIAIRWFTKKFSHQ